jgi:hypothetical protein
MFAELIGNCRPELGFRHITKHAERDIAGIFSTAVHHNHDFRVRAVAFPRRHTDDLETVVLLSGDVIRNVGDGFQADAHDYPRDRERRRSRCRGRKDR